MSEAMEHLEMNYESAGKEAYATNEIVRFTDPLTKQQFAAHPDGHYEVMSRLPARVEPAKPIDYLRCVNCGGPISIGAHGPVHEDADQKGCERAAASSPIPSATGEERETPPPSCEVCGQWVLRPEVKIRHDDNLAAIKSTTLGIVATGVLAWIDSAVSYGVRFIDRGVTYIDDSGSGPVVENIALRLNMLTPKEVMNPTYKLATPERGEDTSWTDEAMRLLDLYVRGFAPVDVARELVGKYRALPENIGRTIFDSNPAYTDAQLLAFQRERGKDTLPDALRSYYEAVSAVAPEDRSATNNHFKHAVDLFLAALKESVRLTDLVRHQRHALLSDKLISQAEFTSLVVDSDNGSRVSRLELYDDAVKRAEQAEAALAARDAKITEISWYLSDTVNQRNDLHEECEKLKGEVAMLANRIENADMEIARLKEELSACTTSPGGCGYWRERSRNLEAELAQLKGE